MTRLLSLALTWFWTLRLYCILYSSLLSLKLSWRLIILLQEQHTGEQPGAKEHEIFVLPGASVVLDAIAV